MRSLATSPGPTHSTRWSVSATASLPWIRRLSQRSESWRNRQKRYSSKGCAGWTKESKRPAQPALGSLADLLLWVHGALRDTKLTLRFAESRIQLCRAQEQAVGLHGFTDVERDLSEDSV